MRIKIETNKNKKTIHYQLGLNSYIKNNKIFIKKFRKKNKKIIKIMIKLKIQTHDEKYMNKFNGVDDASSAPTSCNKNQMMRCLLIIESTY